ncbi:MAG: hypothetical protein H0V98_02570 [Chloroflexia bacterium]|nr:hypothetical protein [Chloroflexia bacterium]
MTESTNLRSSASTMALVIATMPAGTTGTIVAGPLSGSGYIWWQLQAPFGTGWAVENWLEPAAMDPGDLVAQLIERLKAILGGVL